MKFHSYYNNEFRADLASVVNARPSLHEHELGEISIQPRTISLGNPVIAGWSSERRALFSVGLFLTFVTDQVCFTYFHEHYPEFRRLTQYPKWRGDCPGGCYGHIHPGFVFELIGAHEYPSFERPGVNVEVLPDDLMTAMHAEIDDFVSNQMPALDAGLFWERCEAEIPADFRARYMSSRRPAV